jgi:hypothetical protein
LKLALWEWNYRLVVVVFVLDLLWMQAKPKQSSSGVLLGDDVLALVVEPHMDHSLMIALLIVYGLIRRRM